MAKQPLIDVIKYEGDNSTFIWKHPCEDFNWGTQLIVHESQEAIFFLNGMALDSFGSGRHTLETQNIPQIANYYKKFTGGEEIFHCEVYFINKTVQMSIKWGTPEKIRFIEPTMGIPLEIGASGELNLAVSDARKLLLKLVGTMNGIAWTDRGQGFTKSIQDCFRPLISTAVKSNLSASIKNSNIDLLEIDENLETLSEILRGKINPGFEEYGLTIPQFYMTNLILPENDPNFRKLRDIHTVGVQTRMAAAEATVRTAEEQAKRTIALESETTTTELLKRRQERELLEAQLRAQETVIAAQGETQAESLRIQLDAQRAEVEAQRERMVGVAKGEAMAAQGYTQKDVLHADVQKAYAEGIGNIGAGGGIGGGAGGGGGNSYLSDFVSLGVGLAAAGTVSSQMGEMFKGLTPQGQQTAGAQPIIVTQAAQTAAAEPAKCAKCGAPLPEGAKFCLECGEKVVVLSAGEIVCPECGKTVAKGKFCPECGHKFITNCPTCNAELVPGAKFCLQCGARLQPAAQAAAPAPAQAAPAPAPAQAAPAAPAPAPTEAAPAPAPTEAAPAAPAETPAEE